MFPHRFPLGEGGRPKLPKKSGASGSEEVSHPSWDAESTVSDLGTGSMYMDTSEEEAMLEDAWEGLGPAEAIEFSEAGGGDSHSSP